LFRYICGFHCPLWKSRSLSHGWRRGGLASRAPSWRGFLRLTQSGRWVQSVFIMIGAACISGVLVGSQVIIYPVWNSRYSSRNPLPFSVNHNMAIRSLHGTVSRDWDEPEVAWLNIACVGIIYLFFNIPNASSIEIFQSTNYEKVVPLAFLEQHYFNMLKGSVQWKLRWVKKVLPIERYWPEKVALAVICFFNSPPSYNCRVSVSVQYFPINRRVLAK
jgi:hypothetical protein